MSEPGVPGPGRPKVDRGEVVARPGKKPWTLALELGWWSAFVPAADIFFRRLDAFTLLVVLRALSPITGAGGAGVGSPASGSRYIPF